MLAKIHNINLDIHEFSLNSIVASIVSLIKSPTETKEICFSNLRTNCSAHFQYPKMVLNNAMQNALLGVIGNYRIP